MRRPTTTLLLASLLALAACGGDGQGDADLPPAAAASSRPADTTAPAEMIRPTEPFPADADRAGTDSTDVGTQSAAPADAAEQGAAAQPPRRLYTIQLAAFTSADSAVHWTGRLRNLELPVWMSMAERGGTTYYRVRVGAVESFAEARRLGALMRDRLQWPVWVTTVAPQDRPPEDAVAETRRLLAGD